MQWYNGFMKLRLVLQGWSDKCQTNRMCSWSADMLVRQSVNIAIMVFSVPTVYLDF